jgi:hypothetical protein
VFERFHANFHVTSPRRPEAPRGPSVEGLPDVEGLADLLAADGSATFALGLYRLHRADEIVAWDAIVLAAFPEFIGRVTCAFGYDWLGRHFALDRGRMEGLEPMVVMLEPGTGEVLDMPATFRTFHDEVLVDQGDAALAKSFFDAWRAANPGVALDHAACVGYRVPLFLGGVDDLENLEVTDLEVYWSLSGQLRVAVQNQASGTPFRSVTIE